MTIYGHKKQCIQDKSNHTGPSPWSTYSPVEDQKCLHGSNFRKNNLSFFFDNGRIHRIVDTKIVVKVCDSKPLCPQLWSLGVVSVQDVTISYS